MITHIRMKNFKSWKDSEEVKLAPLTGFFGTNSSGKSSLLQMLLLLKQTAESKDVEEVIFFGDENEGSYVNLGNFREVIHGHKDDELLELEFGYKLQSSSKFRIPSKDSFGRPAHFMLDVDSFTFEVVFQESASIINVKHIFYSIGPKKDLKIKWENGRLYFNDRREGSASISSFYRLSGSTMNDLLSHLSSSFYKLFTIVYYLGPARVNPQRYYSWGGGHPKHIMQWGDQTIDALLSARVRKLKTLHGAEKVPIEDKITEWLQKMDLAHSFTLDLTSQGATSYEVRIQKTPASPPVTLVDMGYGLSQFLPVLVLCYYAPEDSTLILEQPGIHLHPMVQAQLADLLIEVVNERNLQILVESHSEHLLTRLQRRIVEEKIAADQTAFYFCRNNEGVSGIEKLDIDKTSGDIKNWPKDFFGDVMGDMFAMADKQGESIEEKGTEG